MLAANSRVAAAAAAATETIAAVAHGSPEGYYQAIGVEVLHHSQSRATQYSDGLQYEVVGGGISEATVLKPARFSITARDEDGESVPTAGMPFIVAIRGVARVRAKVVDTGDGLYTAEWRPPISGLYQIAIFKHGFSLPGSPFHVPTMTPQPHAAHCIVRGDALFRAVSREPHEFQIAFKDKLGFTTQAVEVRTPSCARLLCNAHPHNRQHVATHATDPERTPSSELQLSVRLPPRLARRLR